MLETPEETFQNDINKSNIKNSKNIWIFFQEGGPPELNTLCRHHFLGKELCELGYNVTIFSGSFSHLASEEKSFQGNFKIERNDGINNIWVKLPQYKNSGGIGRIISWITFMVKLFFFPYKRMSKPDYILVSSMPIFPIVNALWLKRKYKVKKIILEIRDIWPLTLTMLGGYSNYNPFIIILRQLEKFAYKNSDIITSVLSDADKHIEASGIVNKQYHWISNGMSREVIKKSYEISNVEKYNLPKDKFIVGYTGALGLANAMEYFLEASKMLLKNSKIHFVIVGDGPFRDSYVEKFGSYSNITFIPKVKKFEVSSLLSCFDLLYVASRNYEIYKYGISANKIFDYMLAGKPILMSSFKHKSYIELANCGRMIPAENSNEIAKAIEEISNMPKEERAKMGENGRQFLMENLTYDIMAKKLDKILVN